MKRKLCVVTGTRAEYGLLYWLLKEIQQEAEFELQIIVTGMHLAPEFGLTYQSIEQDGFPIHEKIEMLLASDTPVGTAKSLGLGVIGFADAFNRLSPDLVIVLGDRFEMLAAAQAALLAKLPIAHIAGGDITEGAFDEAIRHSITKMSQLHFVTNTHSARRVRQLGEEPSHIYNVGSLSIDAIRNLKLLSREQLEKELNFKFLDKNFLITFHPATLDLEAIESQIAQVLEALSNFGSQVRLIFTKPNGDPGGRRIAQLLDEYVAKTESAVAYTTLGQLRYLSVMAQADLVVGNSSSGIYEAPALARPVVNIGDRQKGRLIAPGVINCAVNKADIIAAINKAIHLKIEPLDSPYGNGTTAKQIVSILKSIPNYQDLIKKRFFEVSCK